MKSELSQHSTDSLLQMISDDVNREGDFSYNAEQCLFKRWRNGIDLPFLIELLESEVTRERTRGAFYLQEAVPRGEGFTESAVRLATDSHPYCRRVFVQYMTNSGLYGEAIAAGLAEGLFDYDLGVRLETINWAVYTTDDRFCDFSRLVEAGTGAASSNPWREFQLKRSIRGLSIARRLRAGESVAEVSKSIPDEDSYIFDYFRRFEKHLKGYAEKRRNKVSTPSTGAWSGYDDFEVGVLGEEYDNMGKLKGDLPNLVFRNDQRTGA